jgi:hypothetical protein
MLRMLICDLTITDISEKLIAILICSGRGLSVVNLCIVYMMHMKVTIL